MEMAGTATFFTLGTSLFLSTTTAPSPILTLILTLMRRRQYVSHQECTRLTVAGAVMTAKCPGAWED